MVEVTVLPVQNKFYAEESTSLMDIMSQNKLEVPFVCGGHGLCGKCKVLVSKGNDKNFSDAELKLLSEEERTRGLRLACEMKVEQDICIIIDQYSEDVTSLTKSYKERKNHSYTKKDTFVMAVDLGTTTIVASFLYNREERIYTITRTNPQSSYGLDVVARISYAIISEKNQVLLHEIVIDCFREMIREFAETYHILAEQVKEIVIMGNTTMIHLAFNESLEGLAKVPFTYERKERVVLAKELKIEIKENGKVLTPALIGGHVGTDTLGCILETKMWRREGCCLMIDIGTNGEIVVSKEGKLYACSTAAGPAFEGGNIVQGMKAQAGAVYKAEVRQRKIDYEVIGGGKATGICGSGLIDIVSCMLELRIMDETGRIVPAGLVGHEDEAAEKFVITPIGSSPEVAVYQKDIRQLQLAKAAIYAGVQMLLEHLSICSEELDKIFIAGAFGNNLNIERAVKIGLLPDVPSDKYEYIGNGSLLGGEIILKNEISFQEANEIAKQVTHVELAEQERFQQIFIASMDFNR